jgi:hypothetical protein
VERAQRLPELIAPLVSREPKRVCAVANVLLDVAGNQMSSMSTSWYLGSEWLLDVALRLQDMGQLERIAGTALFERMLEFNLPQAREVSLSLDKRTPTGSGAWRLAKRRPRRSRSRSTGTRART